MAKPKPQAVETCEAVVMHRTADGIVVGTVQVPIASVSWVSPTHVREVQQTRPKDIQVPARKQGALGGQVELRPARLARGVPVLTTIATKTVFGEAADAAALRARGELKKLLMRIVRDTSPYWRHLCEAVPSGLPVERAYKSGAGPCPMCGVVERKPTERTAA